ncbi:MAG: High-affinity zinc uptake system binding-protein ZnuA precursor [Spirochaetes bacterium ADurb.Bin110]|nr:MAG: High-affinity zinc uptake system binding-protein ZnuA precursor [Spirochaetes bacterium ADurb.Bin110]
MNCRFRTIWALLIIFLGIVGLGYSESKKEPIKVAVSIPPMREWVNRIAGDRVEVIVIMPSGSNPHSFEPSPRQLAEIGTAKLWFSINVDFEYSFKPKLRSMFPKLQIVDVTKNVQFRKLRPTEQEHDEEAAVKHVEIEDPALQNRDQHTWLGIEQAKAEIKVIQDTLIAIDPEGKELYKTNCQNYLKDIDSVYLILKTKLAPLSGARVFVYHPAFGYFLDMFDIEQVAVELGGKEPTQRELYALIELAKKEKARAIFTQVQFSESAAKAIASAIGAVVVPIDPLAVDWLENLSRIGQALSMAIAKGE